MDSLETGIEKELKDKPVMLKHQRLLEYLSSISFAAGFGLSYSLIFSQNYDANFAPNSEFDFYTRITMSLTLWVSAARSFLAIVRYSGTNP